jgi:eukaryotic-like serine/threonine-protein kinase
MNTSRRKFIKTVGWVGAGLGLTYVGQRLLPSNNLLPTSKPISKPIYDETFPFETVAVNAKGTIINRRKLNAKHFIEDLGNGITLEMVQIPGDTFTMGSPKDEAGRRDSEGPQRQVTVAGFFMGKFEVTQAQYQAIMGNNPSNFKGDKRPVEQVTWNDATEFCKRLSEKTGRTYRLPSEAEWEYACRAGTTTPFAYGKTITSELANFNATYTYANAPKRQYRQSTTPVGTFRPNAFGLYDMHGNVWEWCADHFHPNYEGAPTDGSAWIIDKGAPIDGNEWIREHILNDNQLQRVLRGGSWDINPVFCRSASRYDYYLVYARNLFGFRVACSVQEQI